MFYILTKKNVIKQGENGVQHPFFCKNYFLFIFLNNKFKLNYDRINKIMARNKRYNLPEHFYAVLKWLTSIFKLT